jgi:TolA-binding protein
MKTNKLRIIALGMLFFSFYSYAQQTEFYTDLQEQIRIAKQLVTRKSYPAAYRQFEKIQEEAGEQSTIASEAAYYKAFCLLHSEHNSGDQAMEQFIESHPASPYCNQALFELGSFQFDKKRYRLAISTLNRVETAPLPYDQRMLLHFQLGYSYMEEENFAQAATEFFEIKDANTLYSKPATYYWAHINYRNGNYESALKELSKLNNDPNYSQVIPLYVSHIYYKQEKYREITQYTAGLIDQVNEKHQPELAKIVGDSYFHLQKYEEAIPYLERYHLSGGLKTHEDNYLLGYCYYAVNQPDKAIPYLERATKGKDETAQNAYYHLADCYIKTENKEKARIAFEAASDMHFDPKIKEDALFNYAKITYELSYSPFSETIKAFDRYIEQYPNSERNNTAYQYLVEVYMVTRNYEDAIRSIENIRVRNRSIDQAYQRVTFYRGLELFNNREYRGAIAHFDKSLESRAGDRTLTARAIFWKAEAFYRLDDFHSAIRQYNQFLLTPGAFSLEEYQDAHYNLAYGYFELEDYQAANASFRKFLQANPGQRSIKIADALNRLGDCWFLVRDYDEAIRYYTESYQMRLMDPDYALFQIAFCEGLKQNSRNKIDHLRMLLTDFPESDYRDDALYELGRAYEKTGNTKNAVTHYHTIIRNYPQSTYYKKALLQQGLIHFNDGNLNEALTFYKRVVENFPDSEEAAAALTGIKNTYVELNNVDAYFSYTRKLGRGEVSANEQDDLTYQAAEKLFMAGEKNAIAQLKKYLNEFPSGMYALNAHFYLGEALYTDGKFTEALEHYQYVTNQSENIFSEPAVSKAAELLLNGKKYPQALELFQRLEAISGNAYNKLKAFAGQMQCFYELENFREAVTAARKVKNAEKTSPLLMRDADYILAQSYLKINDLDQALNAFQKLAAETNSAEGAESKYWVAELLFRKEQLAAAEQEIMDFISKGTPHSYWLGKSFILLSDIYLAQGDEFQSKHTLRSVIENYENKKDGIVNEATKKLDAIETREKAEQEEAQKNPVELPGNRP